MAISSAARWVAVVVVALVAPAAIALREHSDLDGVASVLPLGLRQAQRVGGTMTNAAGRLGAIAASSPAGAPPLAARATAARFASNGKEGKPGTGSVYALKEELAKIHGRMRLDANINFRTWDALATAVHQASGNGFQSEVQQRLDSLQQLAIQDEGKAEEQRLSLEQWAHEVNEVETELAKLADGYAVHSATATTAVDDEVSASDTGSGRKPLTIEPHWAENWAFLGKQKLTALRTRVDEFKDFDHLSDREWNDLVEAFKHAALAGRLVEALCEIKWLDKMVSDYETKTATYKESGITSYDLLMWTEQIQRNLEMLADMPIGVLAAEPLHNEAFDMNVELWEATEAELGGESGAVAKVLGEVEPILDEKIANLDSPGLTAVHAAFGPAK